MSPRTRLAVAAVTVLASSTAVVVAHASADDRSAHRGARAVAAVTSRAERKLLGTPVSTPSWSGYAKKPNILMITSDDLATLDLRYMPHVRALLEQQGVTFSNAVAPTPICVPARASLLSGQYAHNHNARTISGPRGGFQAFDEQRTVPIALQRAGYDTLFTGKYLNGYGQQGSLHYVPPGWTDWRGTVDPSTYLFFRPRINHNGTLTRYHRYTTDVMSDQANQMLRQKRRQHHKWFMWLNYVAPHYGGPEEADDPARLFRGRPAATIKTTVPAPRDRSMYAKKRLPSLPYYFRTPTNAPKHSVSRTHWSKLKRQALRIAYDQRLEAARGVDRAVASQIKTLRETHQLKNTIIIFGGDNGYTTGGHNINGKLWYYDETLRIPLVMRGPGIPQGRKVRTAVTNPDIATTILSAAGATPLRKQDGVNILPWLTAPERNRVVPIEGWRVNNGNKQLYVGVRTDRWTYVRHLTGGGEELFDRRNDPYELHSLQRSPKYHQQLVTLRALTRRYQHCQGSTCPKQFYRA